MRIAVFCGASSGRRPVYRDAAFAFGRLLAERGIGLVYGGGHVGLMGAVADGALEAGGEAIGVMPRALAEREIAHRGLTRLDVVPSMHVRKQRMAELAGGFVTLPGGAGTFEEIFEQWTWAQLGIHEKPCGFLNIDGYFDPLMAMVDAVTREGFMKPVYRQMLVVTPDPDEMIRRFATYTPPPRKWTEAPAP
ncbi:TIGR00730 family Rossman fold protein [Nguyenibacter sp. L1]|uniref:LOG family protein n=1 Tax=Nguyenibacter sp. L1 TaxID=3049350 RepID=UPI002B46CF98|nr:TIGR00730 family Rossman fold protein [Nguyenibacter sp. L1]WRH86515.1 TIGR00730 family Rossman fold protein [Nguyenibacter sp. L1]